MQFKIILVSICYKVVWAAILLNTDMSHFFLFVLFSSADDNLEFVDNERRPHFPQFSYSASGNA